MAVVTRFAPSPTGFLHIGGARTALFNYLHAKHNNGKFLLRIEDTDRKRSTQAAIDAIISSLSWLGIAHDGELVFQSHQLPRHVEVAKQLLDSGHAYHCYCSEGDATQQKAKPSVGEVHKCPYRYDSNKIPTKNKPVVRFKTPESGSTTFVDDVYGEITVNNQQIDDMVILRSDSTPTYMFAVVVDDHDMGITQIIRGTDHLTNTSKQIVLYQALLWEVPKFAHVPLIHDEHGHKLSKRHGALGVEEYRKMGILPEALRNYLLRLGWSYGDHEIIGEEQAISWFVLSNIGQSPSCLDFKKLEHLNNHYIKEATTESIEALLIPILETKLNRKLTRRQQQYLHEGLDELKSRAKTINHLADLTLFYVEDSPITIDEEAQKVINTKSQLIKTLTECFTDTEWNEDSIKSTIKSLAKTINQTDIYHCLRAPITGSMHAPSIIKIMKILGREESLKRLRISLKSSAFTE